MQEALSLRLRACMVRRILQDAAVIPAKAGIQGSTVQDTDERT